ncbi:MAG TPA: SDR family oxidoreductase [Anaerolineae bacterium]|nr:SDR family oxidoreductase [Anaerolineae bacterium]
MDLGLRDRVAIVAAASRGLGKACARELAREGARVVICARKEDELVATVAELREATGADVRYLVVDLMDDAQIRHLADETLRRYGRLDVLVTNNGGPPPGYFGDLDDAAFHTGHERTLLSAVRLIRSVLPAMRVQRWGRIVNITSISVKQPIDDLLLSNVYRAGVVGLAKTLSQQVAADGITINNVAPSYTRTERIEEIYQARAAQQGRPVDEVMAEAAAGYPMGRMAEPEELAALVAFLASERASYINGTTIQVDGGYYRGVL